jgi:5-methylcytosine-specific restriction endonuclease McrA
VIPLSRGGMHTASNLDIACASCNMHKHAKLPEEIGMLTLVVA